MLLIAIGYSLIAFTEERLILAEHTLTAIGGLGRRKQCPRTSIARVVETTVIGSRNARARPNVYLFVLDAAGHVLARAPIKFYPENGLAQIQSELRVPWNRVPGDLTWTDARAMFPGSFAWPYAHITLLSLIATPVLIVGIAIGASSFH